MSAAWPQAARLTFSFASLARPKQQLQGLSDGQLGLQLVSKRKRLPVQHVQVRQVKPTATAASAPAVAPQRRHQVAHNPRWNQQQQPEGPHCGDHCGGWLDEPRRCQAQHHRSGATMPHIRRRPPAGHSDRRWDGKAAKHQSEEYAPIQGKLIACFSHAKFESTPHAGWASLGLPGGHATPLM